MHMKLLAGVSLVFVALTCGWAEEPVSADGVSWDPPTLHCIGVRWFVKEAEHPEATVEVAYRRKGEENWRKAMPLRRVETAALQERKPAEGASLYAGSIFELTPDTDYEVRLTLKDKAGAAAEKLATLRTWKEPVAPAPKRTLHVAPGNGGGSGTAADPFKGLAAADGAAQPGNLVLVHAGTYPGPVEFKRGGTDEGMPVVWRATATR